jgi:hypothetical protein
MARMRSIAAPALAAALAVLPAAPAAADPVPVPSGTPAEDLPDGSEELFRMSDPRIVESSGLAASRLHDGVYWTHNDSGDYGPEVYAVDSTGATVATVTLSGAGVEVRDWEAIAVGTDAEGAPAVYVGDIGDNFQGGWPDIRVYRFTEPAELGDTAVEATTFTLAYADGGRDAEAMMVDPRDGRLYVVSKEVAGGVYAAPERLDPEGVNTLTRVDSAPLYATDASFSPDGAHYAIRTYWGATLYDAADGVSGRSVDRIGLPELDQGESLAFDHDGAAVLAGTEGPGSPVWRVPLPAVGAGPSPEAAEEPEATAAPAERGGAGASPLIWTGVGLAVVLIGGIALLVRRA